MIILFFFAAQSQNEKPKKGVLFYQTFDSKASYENWVVTSLSNYSDSWKVHTPMKPRTDIFERMLTIKTKDNYSAISIKFNEPIILSKDKPFILQYEMRAQNNLTCSGGYIKLFDDVNFNQNIFSNETKHLLMFGPDVCMEKNQIGFLFHHKNPKTGNVVEKSMIDPPTTPKDNLNHLYTLIINPNGKFKILLDNEIVKTNDFMKSFDPPIIPPKFVKDSKAKKPDDWDEREYIEDPSAPIPTETDKSKRYIPDPENILPPKGWIETEEPLINDPNSKKPNDWDDELFGEWNPFQIINPKCINVIGCGKYIPPLIGNPNHVKNYIPNYIKNPYYKGKWEPPEIENPEYFEDFKPYLFPPITAIGFEIHNSDSDISFNNILISNDEKEVIEWNKQFFIPRKKNQLNSVTTSTPTPEPTVERSGFSKEKVSILYASLWQIKDSWLDLYNESKSATLFITICIILIPILIMCFGIFILKKCIF